MEERSEQDMMMNVKPEESVKVELREPPALEPTIKLEQGQLTDMNTINFQEQGVFYIVNMSGMSSEQGNMIATTSDTNNTIIQDANTIYLTQYNSNNAGWNLPLLLPNMETHFNHQEMCEVEIPMKTEPYETTEFTDGYGMEVVINTEPESSVDEILRRAVPNKGKRRSSLGHSSTDEQNSSNSSTPNDKERQCDMCSRVLCNKDSLRRHRRLVHKTIDEGLTMSMTTYLLETQKNSKLCKCGICDKVLCNKDSLRRHIRYVHKSMDEEVVAIVSDLPTEIPPPEIHIPQAIVSDNVSTPMTEIIFMKKKKKAACDVCNKLFYNKATVQRHKANIHALNRTPEEHPKTQLTNTNDYEKKKKAKCDICNRKFYDLGTLRRHQAVVHPDCPELNKSGKKGIKSETCYICSKPLYDKGVLRRHLKNIHKIGSGTLYGNSSPNRPMPQKKYSGTSPKARACHVCGKVLYDKGVLRRHLKNIHKLDIDEPPTQLTQQNLPNTIPTSTYVSSESQPSSSSTIQQGEVEISLITSPEVESEISSNEKPTVHTCKLCNETFANSSNLRRHQVLVHKMKITNYEAVIRNYKTHSVVPQRCEICNRTIIGRSNLARHQRKVHKIELKSQSHQENSTSFLNSNDNNEDEGVLQQNEKVEWKYQVKFEPEEVETYSQVEDHTAELFSTGESTSPNSMHTRNGEIYDIPRLTEAELNHINEMNENHLILEFDEDDKTVIEGLGTVFELNEVEECVAEVEEQGKLEGSNGN